MFHRKKTIMRRLFLVILFTILFFNAKSQITLMYQTDDIGVVTVEQADKNIFYFVDLSFNKDNFFEAYSEITFHKNFYKNWSIAASSEIGFGRNYSLKVGYLGGVGYNYKNMQVDLFYRYKYTNGIQLTVSGYQPILKNKFAICGYMDVWSENGNFYLIESQLQWNICKEISIGTEITITNFLNNKIGLYLKYNFNK